MNKYYLSTPVGVKDYTLGVMSKKNRIETVLKELFLNSGYNLIETPTFEYIDVFQNDQIQKPELYKMINRDGEILALKSDMTKSIARVVSTETKNLRFPQRFCYITKSFRYPHAYQGKLHEFTQAGIELIGSNTIYADYEAVSLAVKSLDATLDDYKLHLSSSEFFDCYLEELNITNDQKDQILGAIAKKNVILIKKLFGSDKAFEILSLITESIGKLDLLHKIKKNVKNQNTLASLERLESLYVLLESSGLSKNVYFDFSVLSYGTYYTGINFKGYTENVGNSILEGGRYDNLIGTFGEERSAVGFAIYINSIIEKSKLEERSSTKMIFSKNKEKLIKNSMFDTFISLEDSLADCFQYGKENNIHIIIDYDNNQTYYLEGGEYICRR